MNLNVGPQPFDVPGFRLDLDGLESNLMSRFNGYRSQLALNFAGVGRRIQEEIKDQQLSGRPGLNIVTGNLHDSIKYETVVDAAGFTVTSVVYNENAPYWYYHQNPEGDRAQYLHVYELHQEQGLEWYSDAVAEAMREFE